MTILAGLTKWAMLLLVFLFGAILCGLVCSKLCLSREQNGPNFSLGYARCHGPAKLATICQFS